MKFPFYLILMFILINPNISFGQDDWTKFEENDGLSFSIDSPGEMEKSTKTIKTAVGDLTTITYAYQGKEEDANYLYLLNLVQYPEETFPIDSITLINDYLENSIATSVENVSGNLIYSSDLDNESGKLFRIKYNGGNAVIKGKSIVKNDVFISLQVFTVESKSLNDEMDYFLDSFKAKF